VNSKASLQNEQIQRIMQQLQTPRWRKTYDWVWYDLHSRQPFEKACFNI